MLLRWWLNRRELTQGIQELTAVLAELNAVVSDDFQRNCRAQHWEEVRFLRKFLKSKQAPRCNCQITSRAPSSAEEGCINVGTAPNPSYTEDMKAHASELRRQEERYQAALGKYEESLAGLAKRREQLVGTPEWETYQKVAEQRELAQQPCPDCGGSGSTINRDWQSVPCQCRTFVPNYSEEEARVADSVAEQISEPVRPVLAHVSPPSEWVAVWATVL